MLNFGEIVVFKCTMVKLILSITIFFVNGYQVKAVSLMQGQEATLHFPYPCDSTEVTLQHSYRAPFYHLTDRPSLPLPDDQVHRFKVQNKIGNENCSLNLTISNILPIDQGTYISLVYKDGEIQMHRIWLKVDYPPGKASCVVSEGKGGDWVSIDCTANVGSLSGKIECYQGGVWMPPLTDPTETHTSLKQTILIRKYQPVFCCSSPLPGYVERCECDDTALYLDDAIRNDPCPTISTKTSTTSTYRTPDLVHNSQSFKSSNYPLPPQTTIKNVNKMTEVHWKARTLYISIVFIMIALCATLLCIWREQCNENSNHESQDPPLSTKDHGDDALEKETEKFNQIQKPHESYFYQSLQEFRTHDSHTEHALRKYQSLDATIPF